MGTLGVYLDPIANLEPTNLNREVAALGIALNDFNDVGISSKYFSKIIEKLKAERPLRTKEMFILVKRFSDFEEDHRKIVEGAILNSVSQAAFEKGVSALIGQWHDNGIFSFCQQNSRSMDMTEGKQLFSLLQEGGLKKVIQNGIVTGKYFDRIKHITDLVGRFSGLTKYIKQGISEDDRGFIFEENLDLVCHQLESNGNNQSEVLQILEESALRNLQTNDAWETQLFNKAIGVGFIVTWILKNGLQSSIGGCPQISKIVDAYIALDKNLNLLDKSVPDRGHFWRNQFHLFHRVIPRQFSDGRVGVAMYFNDLVIVEFGPEGNAAYIYKKEDFEKTVIQTPSWRLKSETVVGYRAWLSDGRILHMPDWQTKTQDFLNFIIGSES